MKKVLLIAIAGITILTQACSSEKPLYTWGNYENSSYGYLKKKDAKAEKALIEEYKKVTAKQKGSRAVAPPGMNADYGFILLQAGDNAAGRALLRKEIAIYPEAEVFINRILLMTATADTTAKAPTTQPTKPSKKSK